MLVTINVKKVYLEPKKQCSKASVQPKQTLKGVKDMQQLSDS